MKNHHINTLQSDEGRLTMKAVIFVAYLIGSSAGLHEEYTSLSFEVDESNCDTDNTNEWDLVDYNSVGVEPRTASLALRASTDSCLSIVNHAVVNGSVEIELCLHLVSVNSGVDVLVYDSFDVLRLVYNFTMLNEEYKPGWNTIKIPLEKHKGYINIIGYSTGIEIILIDAVRYLIHTSKEDKVIDIKLNDNIKHEITLITNSEKDYDLIDDMLMIYHEPDDEEEEDSLEGSGIPDVTTEDPSGNEFTSPWNTFTITLTVIAVIGAVSAISYGAYYCGRRRARADTFVEEFDDMESIYTIPRVRPTFRF